MGGLFPWKFDLIPMHFANFSTFFPLPGTTGSGVSPLEFQSAGGIGDKSKWGITDFGSTPPGVIECETIRPAIIVGRLPLAVLVLGLTGRASSKLIQSLESDLVTGMGYCSIVN